MDGRLHGVCFAKRGDPFRVVSFRESNARSPGMRKPMTNEEGEVRELTLAEIKRMRPTAEVAPDVLAAVERLRERLAT
jgi:hypothetical protein